MSNVFMPAPWGQNTQARPARQVTFQSTAFRSLSNQALSRDVVHFGRASSVPSNKQLFTAALRNDVKLLQRIPADVNLDEIRDKQGRTLLMTAVQYQAYEAANYLLDRGADPMALDLHKLPTLYHLLASPGAVDLQKHTQLVYRLAPAREPGSPFSEEWHQYLNVIGPDWKTALIHATEKGFHDIALHLALSGASVRLEDKNKMTPLMYVAWNGDARLGERFIQTLPKKNAVGLNQQEYVNAVNRWGRTALDIARSRGRDTTDPETKQQLSETVAMLLRHGAVAGWRDGRWDEVDRHQDEKNLLG